MPRYIDDLTFDVHAANLGTADDHPNEPLRFYTTTNTRDPLEVAGAPFADNAWRVDIPKFVTERDLERYAERLYKIIEEHTTIDISEEEFMKLIKDDS